MYITLAILVISSIFFILGKIRSDLVALSSLLLLVLFGILSPEEALSGFSNPVVIMMIGLFVVGGAIFQTGLAKMISNKLLKLAGKSELKLFILVILATSFIGAFVSNTGTVALMLPIVVSMAMNANINSSRLLMPLAFASSLGGMMTLIGTPPNLIINEELIKNNFPSLSFFSFTPVGLIALAVGLLYLIPVSKYLLNKKDTSPEDKKNNKSLTDLIEEYQLSKDIHLVMIGKNAPFIRKTLFESNLSEKYDVNVTEILRKPNINTSIFQNPNRELAQANTILNEGDILFVQGDIRKIETMAWEKSLSIVQDKFSSQEELMNSQKHGIAEILVTSTSRLVNLPIKKSRFRDSYSLNILGIQRNETYILKNLKDQKIHSGDILLVQGSWKDIGRLNEQQRHLIVLGQPLRQASKVSITHKAPIAAIIMLLMIGSMMFDFIPIQPVTAVMVASLLMVFSGALPNVEAAYKTINWESVVLIAAMLPMALALEKTGTSELVSNMLVGNLGNYSPYILLASIYFTTSLLTMFISNTATAILVAPIAMSAAKSMEVNPLPFLIAVSVGASMCFASPFSTPPNALVMSAGRYTFMDYVKVGLPLQILMGIVMILILPLLFPFGN
jgi:potassium uptake protein, trk family